MTEQDANARRNGYPVPGLEDRHCVACRRGSGVSVADGESGDVKSASRSHPAAPHADPASTEG